MPSTKLLMPFVILTCATAANASTIWHNGDLTTYNQANWGGDPTVDHGAAAVTSSFFTVYPTGFVILGSHFTMTFDDTAGVLAFMPAIGTPGPLTASVLNPISTSAGTFGGEVLALQLNVDFSDAGLLPGTSGLRFGDLLLENLSATPALNGLTVRQFLSDVNIALGGNTPIYDIGTLDLITADLNGSFGEGFVSSFAQDHLVAPASTATPEPSTFLLILPAVLVLAGRRWRRQLPFGDSRAGACLRERRQREHHRKKDFANSLLGLRSPM